MRIVCLISWFEEKPAWLAGLVASMKGTADHVVAVDGAYALYPRSRARSESAQAEAIRETARGLGMGCTIHEPPHAWVGNEVEKRDFMFRLGEQVTEPDDWYFVMDGDELLTETGRDLHAACAEATRDAGEVTMWQLREHAEPHERPYVTDLTETQTIRVMFRAIRGLRVKDRHYHYVTPDGRYLWGDGGTMAEAEDFSSVRIQHRNKSRDLWRAKDARTYYDTRDSLGVEALTR